MTREWQTAVTDPTDRRVFEALEDPRWDFRTVEGLSKTTGLPETTVRNVLARHPCWADYSSNFSVFPNYATFPRMRCLCGSSPSGIGRSLLLLSCRVACSSVSTLDQAL